MAKKREKLQKKLDGQLAIYSIYEARIRDNKRTDILFFELTTIKSDKKK
jgi:hypothetical protein